MGLLDIAGRPKAAHSAISARPCRISARTSASSARRSRVNLPCLSALRLPAGAPHLARGCFGSPDEERILFLLMVVADTVAFADAARTRGSGERVQAALKFLESAVLLFGFFF